MAITTLAEYKDARKQLLDIWYSQNITTAAGNYATGFPNILLANQTSGRLATDVGSRNPPLDLRLLTAPAGQNLYLTKAKVSSGRGSATNFPFSRVALFDRIFECGTYNALANQTLSGQPSIAGRVENGNYSDVELWIEWQTAATARGLITIGYTNQSGVSGRTTSYTPSANTIVRRLDRLPLQSGDTGIQRIDSVVDAGNTGGAFNVLLLRKLAYTTMGGGDQATHYGNNNPRNQGILHLGMPQIFDATCLMVAAAGTSTSSGTFGYEVEIASG